MAAAWVASIPDANQRSFMIENVVHNWLENDPAAARVWLDQTDLSPERKQALLKNAGQ
jgi:hypothetical protein